MNQEAIREARRKYYREYYKELREKNPKKLVEYQLKFWQKKAIEYGMVKKNNETVTSD